MRKYSFHIFLFIAIVLFASCKPTVPDKYIQPDDFEDILYDRYISKAMANEEKIGENVAYYERLYWLGVLKKHDVTEAEFDSSLVYYTRHADKMTEIYKNLVVRLQDEAMSLGTEASELNKFSISTVGDTANIWTNERNLLLMQYAPYNKMSYSIKNDTVFRKGDRLLLSFDTKFIFQDGYKDGIAMLSVHLGNDSIVTRTIHMSSDSHYTLDIIDNEELGIKEVNGFIYLSSGRERTSNTLRLLFVDNIGLVRMHKKATEKKEEQDSAKVSKMTDTLAVEPKQGDNVVSQ